MKPHPKIRKTVKWGGAIVSLLLAVVWIGSWWCWGQWTNSHSALATAERGRLRVVQWAGRMERRSRFSAGWLHSWPPQVREGPYLDLMSTTFTDVPLWIPACASLLVTAAAWSADIIARRRARIGLCHNCSYSRTGLAPSAVCPECGAAASREER